MSSKRKIIYLVIFSIVTLITLFVSGYLILINSTWYHWREINRFKKNHKSYGGLGEGSKIYYHFNKLIAKGEIEHSQFSVNITFPSGDFIEDIKKKFPSLIWITIHPYETQIPDKPSNYSLDIWAKSDDMALVKDFIAKKVGTAGLLGEERSHTPTFDK